MGLAQRGKPAWIQQEDFGGGSRQPPCSLQNTLQMSADGLERARSPRADYTPVVMHEVCHLYTPSFYPYTPFSTDVAVSGAPPLLRVSSNTSSRSTSPNALADPNRIEGENTRSPSFIRRRR